MNVNNSIKELVSGWSIIHKAVKGFVAAAVIRCENEYYVCDYEVFYKGPSMRVSMRRAFWGCLLSAYDWSK